MALCQIRPLNYAVQYRQQNNKLHRYNVKIPAFQKLCCLSQDNARNINGKETGVFSRSQPRQAALKAANRSKGTKSKPVEIRMRERGTKKVHIFKGWKVLVSAPKNKPSWMPAKINKPNVKKAGVENLKKL